MHVVWCFSILELSNNRVLEDLTNKWWDSNNNHRDCPRIENESDGISIKNIGGVFLLIAIGTGLSLIAFACEYYYYKVRPKRQERLYAIKGKTPMSRIESEVSLHDITVEQNPAGDKNVRKAQHGRIVDHSHKNGGGVIAENGNKTSLDIGKHAEDVLLKDSKTHRRRKSAKNNNNKVDEEFSFSNGAPSEGVSNSGFVYDTPESLQRKYPDLHLESVSERFPDIQKRNSQSHIYQDINKDGDIQKVFSEKM